MCVNKLPTQPHVSQRERECVYVCTCMRACVLACVTVNYLSIHMYLSKYNIANYLSIHMYLYKYNTANYLSVSFLPIFWCLHFPFCCVSTGHLSEGRRKGGGGVGGTGEIHIIWPKQPNSVQISLKVLLNRQAGLDQGNKQKLNRSPSSQSGFPAQRNV